MTERKRREASAGLGFDVTALIQDIHPVCIFHHTHLKDKKVTCLSKPLPWLFVLVDSIVKHRCEGYVRRVWNPSKQGWTNHDRVTFSKEEIVYRNHPSSAPLALRQRQIDQIYHVISHRRGSLNVINLPQRAQSKLPEVTIWAGIERHPSLTFKIMHLWPVWCSAYRILSDKYTW